MQFSANENPWTWANEGEGVVKDTPGCLHCLSPREEFQNKVRSQDRLKYTNIVFGNKPVKFILLLEIADKDASLPVKS